MNSRLDSMQAAVLLAKLEVFDDELQLRAQKAATYDELLQHPQLQLPQLPPGQINAWAQYTIASKQRDNIIAQLQAAAIPYSIYYPVSLHQQPAFVQLNIDYRLPVCEQMQDLVLSLPMHPYLSLEQQQRISEVVLRCL